MYNYVQKSETRIIYHLFPLEPKTSCRQFHSDQVPLPLFRIVFFATCGASAGQHALGGRERCRGHAAPGAVVAQHPGFHRVVAWTGQMTWVCLKMLCTPLYPMVLLIMILIKWLFHWEYAQHFQTNPPRHV